MATNYYKERHPNRRHPDRRTIQRAKRTLAEHESFDPLRRHGGRFRQIKRNVEGQILQSVEELALCSRQLASRHGVCVKTVSRILRENEFHTYHICRVTN
ncbi:hypothetical protein WH47_00821 [Habropoda laboriosa]|uniref:DUF4817 domain-containing protein n=1 Tax=Habropoda laboriosa TaxID=597456 RepID=A0A0L7QKA2_9HYME|nr:hypothetical protein WH47_00821 [Habropoda laboriosa]